MEQKRVLIIQRIFSHYRKPLFDRLAEDFDLKLIHTSSRSSIKQAKAHYAVCRKGFKFYKKETTIYIPVIRIILQFRPDVVIHEFNPSIPSVYLLFVLKFILGFKIILWGHGINSQKIYKNKKLSIKIRLKLAKAADAILLYGKRAVPHFENSINPNKIFIAYNTLDTEEYGHLNKELLNIGHQRIKRDLGIQTSNNIIFVGRLLQTKILPIKFVQIVNEINKSIKDLGVHVIGDGPAKEELIANILKYNVSNIYLHGEKYGEDVCKYLFISDLLMNPGYLGLSIIHAFSFNTPVAGFKEGQTGPYHSPEIEYIKNWETGFLAADNDIKCLSSFMVRYFNDEKLRTEMKANASNVVYSNYTIENMCNGFNNAIKYVYSDK